MNTLAESLQLVTPLFLYRWLDHQKFISIVQRMKIVLFRNRPEMQYFFLTITPHDIMWQQGVKVNVLISMFPDVVYQYNNAICNLEFSMLGNQAYLVRN